MLDMAISSQDLTFFEYQNQLLNKKNKQQGGERDCGKK